MEVEEVVQDRYSEADRRDMLTGLFRVLHPGGRVAISDAFLAAGFVAVEYDKWEHDPWQVFEGIELRSVTLCAVKPLQADESGQTYPRGVRVDVSSDRFSMLQAQPYAEHFIAIEPTLVKGGGC
ncbi:MAG: arsenite methyltransferase [Halieaceae bacterium]|jgi:arsenite methyltransferase